MANLKGFRANLLQPLAVVIMLALNSHSVSAKDPRFWVGVCTHLGKGKGNTPASVSLMQGMGIKSLRDELSWSAVERQKGVLAVPAQFDDFINQSIKAGIEPLLILDYGNKLYDNGDKPLSDEAIQGFTRYADFIVNHFRGRVKLYEIWNEWDGNGLGGTKAGTADAYIKLVKVVAPKIKGTDSSITVIGGAVTHEGLLNGYFEKLLDGGMLPLVDALSIHPYNYFNRGSDKTPVAWLSEIKALEEKVKARNNNREFPLYITELGWPTHSTNEGTVQDKVGAYLAQTYLLARTLPYVRGLWWYDLSNDGWEPSNKEQNFGLVQADLSPKPTRFAINAIANLVSNSEFIETVDAGNPDLKALKFRLPDGTTQMAVWGSPNAGDSVEVASNASGSKRMKIAHVLKDAPPTVQNIKKKANVDVGEMPTLISGSALTLKDSRQ